MNWGKVVLYLRVHLTNIWFQSLYVKMLTKSQLAHFRIYNLGKIEPTLCYNYPKLHLDLEKVLVLYLLPFKYQIRLDFWHFPKPNIRDFWKIGLGRKLKYLRAEYICQNGACRFNCPGTEIWQRFEREKLLKWKWVNDVLALHLHFIWLNDCTMFNHLAKFKVTNTLVAASIVHQFAFHFLLLGPNHYSVGRNISLR